MIPIQRFGEPLHRNPNASNELQFCCPQCHIKYPNKHPDISYHLYYNVKKDKFFCHRCGYKGSLKSLPQDFSIVPSWEEITKALEDLNHHRDSTSIEKISLPPESIRILSDCSNVPGFVSSYLNSRGISSEDIFNYDLHYSPTPWPIIIFKITMPALMAWVGRSIFSSAPHRYYNVPGSWRNRAIFNYKCRGIPIKICEGPISAILAGPNAVATLGINFSDQQVEVLCALKSSFYLVSYDGGEPGSLEYIQANKLAKELYDRGKRVAIARLPSGVDPADLGREKYLRTLESSTCVYNYAYELQVGLEALR
jgi:hypothetical protein